MRKQDTVQKVTFLRPHIVDLLFIVTHVIVGKGGHTPVS